MKTPNGIDLKIGQKWREVENRFERIVTITGFDEPRGKVQLNNRTWASIKRFHGKHGGYELKSSR